MTAAAPEPLGADAPNDVAAERAVLGAAMSTPNIVIDACSAHITGNDFYDPRHSEIWSVIRYLHASGAPTDPIAVRNELLSRLGPSSRQRTRGTDDASFLATIYAAATTASSAAYYAAIIDRASRQRALLSASTVLHQLALKGRVLDDTELDQALGQARDLLDGNRRYEAHGHAATDTVQRLAQATDEENYDWIIPGLLERGDRAIITGPEGGGKSTLLRQFGIQAACGIHPFTGQPMTPITVMHVDLENSERQTIRALRPLVAAAAQAGAALQPGQHFMEILPGGLDLLQPADATYLRGICAAVRPDILLTGPLYRMASGDPIEEQHARAVSSALDSIRALGVAVLLEAHTPHAAGGVKHRPTRPYGASLWLRWPEFGIHLAPDGEISHWRGARDVREWPTCLQRGGDWPWTSVADERAQKWHRIRVTREEFGEQMSVRDVAEATGINRNTVHRLIGPNGPFGSEWQLLNGTDGDSAEVAS